jgi:hypothetical protein
MVGETVRRMQFVQKMARTGSRVVAGAAAVQPQTNKPKRVPIFVR